MSHVRLISATLALFCYALPAAAQEGETWEPYKFRGTEHFKYEMNMTEDGDTQTGWYTLDLEPRGGDQVWMKVKAAMGEATSEFSTTAAPDAVHSQLLPQLMMSPAGAPMIATLFAPWWGMYFAGRDWAVGAGWSFSDGAKQVSFKVEDTCSYAGVEGKNVVWREDDEVRGESCIAIGVALPLAVSFRDDSGRHYKVTLTEYNQ